MSSNFFTLKHQLQGEFFRTLSESDAYFLLEWSNDFLMFRQKDTQYCQDRVGVYRVYYSAKDLQ